MSRTPKDPLRELTDTERKYLVKTSRSASERAEHVRRAKALLAVADGASQACGHRGTQDRKRSGLKVP